MAKDDESGGANTEKTVTWMPRDLIDEIEEFRIRSRDTEPSRKMISRGEAIRRLVRAGLTAPLKKT